MIHRSLLVIACLVCSGVVFSRARQFYGADMLAPEFDLTSLPLQFGEWDGAEVSVSDATVRVIDAHSYVSRCYRDSIGREIDFHAAAFTRYEYRGTAPHHPDVCYPAAGWNAIGRQSVQLDVDGSAYPVEFTLFRRRNLNVVTMHWYIAGDNCFTDAGAPGLSGFWGQQECPCAEKYLAQAKMPSLEMAVPILSRFGRHVLRRRLSGESSQQAKLPASL